jgi:hypothetical protein
MPPSANQLPDPDLVLAPELASPEPLVPRPHDHSQYIQQEKLFLKLSRAGQSTRVIAGFLLNQDPRAFDQLHLAVQRAPFQSSVWRHLVALDGRSDTELRLYIIASTTPSSSSTVELNLVVQAWRNQYLRFRATVTSR